MFDFKNKLKQEKRICCKLDLFITNLESLAPDISSYDPHFNY